jgi:hypothetical protein
MKSRLFTALAIGALSVAMVPGIASADQPTLDVNAANATEVNVTVSEGTTLYVPALIEINTLATSDPAFPGQIVDGTKLLYTGNPMIEWFSNQESMFISADMPDLRQGPAGTQYIADEDVSLFLVSQSEVPDHETEAVKAQEPVGNFGGVPLRVGTIDDVSNLTDEDLDSQRFSLQVFIPSADEGMYSADITWSVLGGL